MTDAAPPATRTGPARTEPSGTEPARTEPARTEPARTETARTRLLDAAVRVIRQKGYHATSVEELCTAAGVTKGAFFHHFQSKQDLGVAAARYWTDTTGDLFAQAPYHAAGDPLGRVMGYLDFRAALIAGPAAEYTCLVGTMAQEIFLTSPPIRDACFASIGGHAQTLEADLEAAIGLYGVSGDATAHGLALHTQVILQGAFILAKAKNDPAIVVESIGHLRRYFGLLFRPSTEKTS